MKVVVMKVKGRAAVASGTASGLGAPRIGVSYAARRMMEDLPGEATVDITENIPIPPRTGWAEEFMRLAEQIVINSFLNGTSIRLDGAVRLPPR